MKLLDDIKEITKDISDDIDTENKRSEQFEAGTGRYRRNRGGEYGLYKVAIPNFIGFLVGLAFARLFEFPAVGYFILGIIFAVGIGVLENTVFGGMNLKASIIRNCIIVLFICMIFGIVSILPER